MKPLQKFVFAVGVGCLITLSAGAACAEIRPKFSAMKLTRCSDLIVLGRQSPDGQVHIENLLKGKYSSRQISAAVLSEHTTDRSFLDGRGKLEFGGRLVLFLSLRRGMHVVANGVFRQGKVDGVEGVFDYHQPMNPGGYSIDPHPRYRNLSALVSDIEKALADIPRLQKELLAKALSEPSHTRNLHELQEITCAGDMEVLRAVAEMYATDTRRSYRSAVPLSFIQDVGDPDSWMIVKELYERTDELDCLRVIGRLRHPDGIAYLRDLHRETTSTDVREHAAYALRQAAADE